MENIICETLEYETFINEVYDKGSKECKILVKVQVLRDPIQAEICKICLMLYLYCVNYHSGKVPSIWNRVIMILILHSGGSAVVQKVATPPFNGKFVIFMSTIDKIW